MQFIKRILTKHRSKNNALHYKSVRAGVDLVGGIDHQVLPIAELEAQVLALFNHTGRRLQLLLVEDDPVYAEMFRHRLAANPSVESAVELHLASGSGEAFAKVDSLAVDLFVCDLDLGDGSLGGRDIITALRGRGFTAVVCVHSNNIGTQIYRDLLDGGADFFITKPMSYAHLLKLAIAGFRLAGRRSIGKVILGSS